MSFEHNMNNKSNDSRYFTMIYEPNENKNGFYFYEENKIKIFGQHFVKQNKNKCKIIYNNKKYKLKDYLNEIDSKHNHNIKEIKLKLIGINNITEFCYMFYRCFHLISVSESKYINIQQDIHNSYDILTYNNFYSSLFEEAKETYINERNNINIDINNELNKEYKKSIDFYDGCILSSFENISSISKVRNNYNSKNCKTILNCYRETSINFNKIKDISCMFCGCISLKSLPNISNLDTSNVTDMNSLFNECILLISLPDISRWNTSNVTDMGTMFNKCNILINDIILDKNYDFF